uniref:Disease resistance protein At4g27190-like leucine-rich repeats domain-containing protein n=1 Tax=Nelumbo nucifera TaxID=4432 RepID=A0A822ZGX0_NELNU|nr:TPA_asm: hypothetical protein HUJ06_001970 [Nelumbo nucifera]
MVERNAIIRLDILSEEEAWGLFKRKVGDGVEQGDFHKWQGRWLRSARGIDQQVYTCVRWSYDYLDNVETQRFFLYCCLFPEDYEIEIEQMMWYCFGAGVFVNVETIEDERCRTRRIVNKLKASSLLLQGESPDFIKMHDIVRDVAISIVSPCVAVGNRSHHDELFMVRAGKGLTEWPRMESGITKAAAGYTAISLMNNDIQKLPAADGLLESSSSGRLRTLLLQKYFKSELEIPNTFFGGVIKSLTTLDLSKNDIIGPSSLSPIQCLTNLRTLNLGGCTGLQQEISVLGSLKQLVILRPSGCNLERLPPDMAQLTKLRLLDLSNNEGLIIPPNVISSWSHLEELYLFGSFCEWEKVQGITTGEEQRAAASLAELKSLHGLTTLQVMVEVKNSSKSLPDGFVFHDQKRFFIVMYGDDANGTMNYYGGDWFSNSPVKGLVFKNLPAQTTKVVCSNQLQRTQVLELYDCKGVRSIMEELDDKMGFNCLEALTICGCNEVEYLWPTHPISIIAKSSQLAVFTNLEKSHIESMQVLKGIICPAAGPLPLESLAKLKHLHVLRCPGLLNIVTPNLYPSLQKLETLNVIDRYSLEEIFHFEGILSDDHHQSSRTSSSSNCAQLWFIRIFEFCISTEIDKHMEWLPSPSREFSCPKYPSPIKLPKFEKHLFMPKFKLPFLISRCFQFREA